MRRRRRRRSPRRRVQNRRGTRRKSPKCPELVLMTAAAVPPRVAVRRVIQTIKISDDGRERKSPRRARGSTRRISKESAICEVQEEEEEEQ